MENLQTKSLIKYLEKQEQIPFEVEVIGSVKRIDLAVVIPSYYEQELELALESLIKSASNFSGNTAIVVVLNSRETSSPSVGVLHKRQWEELKKVALPSTMELHVLLVSAMPSKHGGVGLARKTGLDYILAHCITQTPMPILINFDADSLVDSNYLSCISEHFSLEHPNSPAASIYFEHPLDDLNPNEKERIVAYELHLRLYRQMIKSTGHPFAFHTVGSSMACTAEAYIKQGGMNKRKAGEDFYFLNKLMMLGKFTEINGTRVLPSARESDRVPFGTGRAMLEMAADNNLVSTYSPKCFSDLKELFGQLEEIYGGGAVLNPVLSTFMVESGYGAKMEKVRLNCPVFEVFEKRFFELFDLFAVMKFIHFMRDHYFQNEPLTTVFREMFPESPETSLENQLMFMRKLERNYPQNGSLV
ncbi:MAG: hypothetical protein ACJAY8_001097 [Sphingobacteriales bacterium]|jgi:hypothetical protein